MKEERLPPLRHLYLNPSGGCNLCCAHCWIAPERTEAPFGTRPPFENEISPPELERIIGEALPLGLVSLKFTGGEPLLRSDFTELYSTATGSGVDIHIETNGTLEPPGIWSAFGEKAPDTVAVSLDSVNPELHDRFRRTPGAWGRTRDFISRLVDMETNTQVIMSVLSSDPSPVLGMAALCREMGVGSLKVNPVQPMGRGRELREGRSTPVHGILDMADAVHRSTGRSVILDLPPAFVPVDRLEHHSLCPVLNLLGVLPDGGVSFCGIGFSLPSLVMGNVREAGIQDVWADSSLLALLRRQVPWELEGICSRCIHRNSCMGKCVMQNRASGGSFTSPHWFCSAAEAEGLFPRSRKVPM